MCSKYIRQFNGQATVPGAAEELLACWLSQRKPTINWNKNNLKEVWRKIQCIVHKTVYICIQYKWTSRSIMKKSRNPAELKWISNGSNTNLAYHSVPPRSAQNVQPHRKRWDLMMRARYLSSNKQLWDLTKNLRQKVTISFIPKRPVW